MTSHVRKFCVDCGTPYYFQASGWGAPDNNDSMWCPECATLINNVRNNIVRKYDWRWVSSEEYTLDELKIIEEENQKKSENDNFGLNFIRVFPGLIDLNNRNNLNIIREVKTPKGIFLYNYWTEAGNISISKKVYWDLLNNTPSGH